MCCFLRQKNLGPAKILLRSVLRGVAELVCRFVVSHMFVVGHGVTKIYETRFGLQAIRRHSCKMLTSFTNTRPFLGVPIAPLYSYMKPFPFFVYS
jgi:hypothetical protein